MNSIPSALRQRLADDPYMKVCARSGSDCDGRITFEHSIIVAGQQLQRAWAIIPLCERHHLGNLLNKNLNRLIALNRATDDELDEFPKANLRQLRDGLRNQLRSVTSGTLF